MPGSGDGLTRDGGALAARAIMTTDPFPKEAAVEVTTAGGRFRVGGMAKGSGMIEPMMATMLAVVTTDAQVDPALLQRALSMVTEETFNAISVDGECSTNDCVFALASGASGVALKDADLPVLTEALRHVCQPLALDIVRGGEGATKLVTIDVTGAQSREEARRAARAIANSPLVKTAIHGADPNWGRLVAVAGRAGVGFSAGSRARADWRRRAVRGRPAVRRSRAGSRRGIWPDAKCRVQSISERAAPAKPGCGPATSARNTCGSTRSIEHEPHGATRPVSDLAHDAVPLDAGRHAGRGRDVLDLAASMKAARHAGRPHATPLAGQHVALLFEKPSLRTRSSS